MDDKVYGLMEKMYMEFTSFKAEMTDFKAEMTDFRTKIEIKLENEVIDEIKGLYDDRAEVKESLAAIHAKLDHFARVDEDHELRIRALEGVG
ncbi:MAG: hypothetical protein CVV03_04950 [Firmicutes bacterium HGW-Firmicutes-8]|nr:MAG: hypothetical protein CVV03_04950 [Firmicutes bacterium HGW-Firmicutes-8]